MRTAQAAAALILPLALLVACGDEEKSEKKTATTTETTTQTTGGADEAVATYLEAFTGGDYETVCAMQTETYTNATVSQMAQEGEEIDCIEATGRTVEMLQMLSGQEDLTGLWDLDSAEVIEDGDTATVSISSEGESSEFELSLIDGAWYLDGDGVVQEGDDTLELEQVEE